MRWTWARRRPLARRTRTSCSRCCEIPRRSCSCGCGCTARCSATPKASPRLHIDASHPGLVAVGPPRDLGARRLRSPRQRVGESAQRQPANPPRSRHQSRNQLPSRSRYVDRPRANRGQHACSASSASCPRPHAKVISSMSSLLFLYIMLLVLWGGGRCNGLAQVFAEY